MLPLTRSTALVLLALVAAPAARAADPAAVVAAKRALSAAVDSASAPAIVEARARFQALAAAEPGDPTLRLWVASATWRAVPLLQRKEPARAERLLRDGLQNTEEAIRLDPASGEALALEAALQGLLLGFDPSAMMTLGPEAEANLARARTLSPASPRVWFLQGIHSLHKPAAFGGSAALAREQFERAIALFEKAPAADSTALDWGYADALLWAGQAAMATGDPRAAVSFYERGLERDPGNRWLNRLLPAARDSAARGKP